MQIEINADFLRKLRQYNIALKWYPNAAEYRCASLNDSWLKEGAVINLNREIKIEPCTGLYGGAYHSAGAGSYHGLCSIGSFSYSFSPLPEGLVIGRYCSIGKGLQFLDGYHPTNKISTSVVAYKNHFLSDMYLSENSLGFFIDNVQAHDPAGYPVIGNDVWIGQDATLKMGVKIGDGAIIAANTVVTSDVPTYAIVAGNPARIVKMRFDSETIGLLLYSKIYEYNLVDLAARRLIDFAKPKKSAEAIIDLLNKKEITTYSPNALSINPAIDCFMQVADRC